MTEPLQSSGTDNRDRPEVLFSEALALPDPARASFIVEACADDVALRDELLSLLRHAGPGEELFDRLSKFAVPDVPPASFRAGRFEIVGCVGVGGMGAVYRAHDSRLARDVALKFLPTQTGPAADAENPLLVEARAVAALEHPNICTVHEIGETEDGRPFIAMTLYDGETLKERLTAGPIAVPDALNIAAGIARGLSAAHVRGLVHRDVKPGNVMLTTGGVVKLLDFGLATPSSASPAGGITPGTIPYMSPEQLRGDAVGPQSDLWSLGVVLYEMLSGGRPFVGGDHGAVVEAILRSPPKPLRDGASNVSRSLQHIVGKLLEKDVVRRYADANELLADLTREIATSAPRGRLVGSLPRSPGGIMGVAAAALALAIGGATLGVRTYGRLSTSSASPPVEVKSITVLPFSSLAPSDDEEYLTDGLAEGLTGVLSSVQALSVVGRTSAFNFKHGRQDVQQVGRVLHVGSVVTGTVERLGDRLRVHARLYNTADGRQLWADSSERSIANVVALQHDLALHIATALGAKLSSSERERLSRRATANAEAYALYLRGRYFWNQRTSSAYARAMEYFHRAIEIDSTYAPAYAGVAAVYSQQGMAGQLSLERAQARSHAAALRAVALDSTLAEGHAVLGVYLHSYEWDSGAAERELKRAIELDPNFALAHHYYGNVLRSLGRLDEAIVQNRKAVELEPLVPGFSETLAFTLMRAGRPAEALEQIRAALELDSTYWRAHAVLGIVYEGMHRDADAIRAYERANQLAGPAAHRSTAALARVLARIGRDRDARRLVDTLRSMAKRTGTYEADVASALYALGDVSECFAWLERAYRQRNPDLRYIDGDPRFVPLNHEPRFVDLMRRVGVRH